MTPQDKVPEKLEAALGRLLSEGAPIAGALAGTAMAAPAALPVVIGATAGGLMIERAVEFVGRVLFGRERERASAALFLAVSAISERMAAGEKIRTDGFFEEGTTGRAASAEFLEGMLRKAAEAYEERKVPFLASLFENLAFNEHVTAEEAHYFLQVADRLTFRQLCFLALFASGEFQNDVSRIAHALIEPRGIGLPGITRGAEVELIGLANEALLGYLQQDGSVVHPAATLGGGKIVPKTYERLHAAPSGKLMYGLMGLDKIQPSDTEGALSELAGDPSWREKAT